MEKNTVLAALTAVDIEHRKPLLPALSQPLSNKLHSVCQKPSSALRVSLDDLRIILCCLSVQELKALKKAVKTGSSSARRDSVTSAIDSALTLRDIEDDEAASRAAVLNSPCLPPSLDRFDVLECLASPSSIWVDVEAFFASLPAEALVEASRNMLNNTPHVTEFESLEALSAHLRSLALVIDAYSVTKENHSELLDSIFTESLLPALAYVRTKPPLSFVAAVTEDVVSDSNFIHSSASLTTFETPTAASVAENLYSLSPDWSISKSSCTWPLVVLLADTVDPSLTPLALSMVRRAVFGDELMDLAAACNSSSLRSAVVEMALDEQSIGFGDFSQALAMSPSLLDDCVRLATSSRRKATFLRGARFAYLSRLMSSPALEDLVKGALETEPRLAEVVVRECDSMDMLLNIPGAGPYAFSSENLSAGVASLFCRTLGSDQSSLMLAYEMLPSWHGSVLELAEVVAAGVSPAHKDGKKA